MKKIFANHFSEANDHVLLSLVYEDADNNMINCPFQHLELQMAIRKTKTTSSCEDRIRSAFFEGLNENTLLHLLRFYNTFGTLVIYTLRGRL